MTDQTTDRHTCHNQKTAAGPAWKCPRCSLPPAHQTAPLADRLAHPEAVREQVRRALDFTYAVSLGYESSDQLLATYDASRTPADQTPLREKLARAIYGAHSDVDVWDQADDHTRRVVYAEADAVLAVLPAPADRAAVLREAADALALDRDSTSPSGGRGGARQGMTRAVTLLRRMADETATTETQAASPVQHAPGKAVRCPDCRAKGYTVCLDEPAVEVWRGATEVISDREVERLAATGLVGYRQGRGRLLHCLHHKPVPASRWADFHEVAADDLPDGGICVHPRCGADLLAVAGARQDGAQ